jgi:putative NADPH-quinone reductase
MQVLVIIAHPNPMSFNHALARQARQTLEEAGHRVIFHDLCAEGFDPCPERGEIAGDVVEDPVIQTHCREVQAAEGLVIVHPNWWGQPPAVLKGWIDRVFRAGVAYRFLAGDNGEGVPQGLLKIKTAVVFNTSNTAEDREQTVMKDPLETLWKNCILQFCGVQTVQRRMFSIVVTSSAAQRQNWIQDVQTMIQQAYPAHEKHP